MANVTFLAISAFTASKVGKTSLADVTVDIAEFNFATQACNATFLVGQTALEALNGSYYLFFTGSEDCLYLAYFKTADATVDCKWVPELGVLLHRLGSLDADISSRAATGADGDTLETLSDQIDGVSTFDPSSDAVTLAALQGLYAPAKAGDAMTLTAAYDAAKSAAPAGTKMDLVDAPNSIAITAIQAGLAVPGDIPTSQEIRDAMKLAPSAGDPAAGSIDKHLDDIDSETDPDGSSTYPAVDDPILTAAGAPVAGVKIECYSDSGYATLVQTATSDINGLWHFHLNPGTYYFRIVEEGYDFAKDGGDNEWSDTVT